MRNASIGNCSSNASEDADADDALSDRPSEDRVEKIEVPPTICASVAAVTTVPIPGPRKCDS